MDIPVLLWVDVAERLPPRGVIALGMVTPTIGAVVAPVLRRKFTAQDVLGWLVPERYGDERAHVAECSFLAEHYDVGGSWRRKTRHRALLTALDFGWLEAAEWLVTHLGLTQRHARMKNNLALQRAAEGGRPDVCRWLVERFHLTAQDCRANSYAALCTSVRYGRTDVCRWLAGHFHLELSSEVVERLLAVALEWCQEVCVYQWLGRTPPCWHYYGSRLPRRIQRLVDGA